MKKQGYEWNGRPITTEAEYNQALQEQDYQEKGYDPEDIKKIVENLPEVKWANEQRSKQQREDALQQDQIEFLDWFKEKNGRDFDVKTDKIADEVWLAHQQGASLKEEIYSKSVCKLFRGKTCCLRK